MKLEFNLALRFMLLDSPDVEVPVASPVSPRSDADLHSRELCTFPTLHLPVLLNYRPFHHQNQAGVG